MRVIVVGPEERGGGSLAAGLTRGADDAGHDAVLVSARTLIEGSGALIRARRVGVDSVLRRVYERDLERRLEAAAPDIVVVVKGRFIDARLVKRLRDSLACPIVNYYPDDPYASGLADPATAAALPAYDEVVTWAPHIAEALDRNGVRSVRVIRFAYDPALYRPPPAPLTSVWDAVLIGQCYPVRLRYVEALCDLNLFVTGLGWKAAAADGPLAGRVGGVSIPAVQTCETYWRARVALNVLHPVNVPAHNMRSFEIPATGTPMVATRTPEHVDLFGEDGAVLVDSPTELRSRLRALLDDPDELARIGARGLERVRPHTYAARMRELLAPWAS